MENQFFDRISEYYSGEKDQEALKKDLESDPKTKELFHWIGLFWDKLRPGTWNTENIQKRTRAKIEARQSPGSLFRLGAVKYAAAVLLALAIGSAAYYFAGSVQMIKVSSGVGDMKVVELPDGSKVWLNAQSLLIYPEKFKGRRREVTIKGEAFFKVKHDSDHPFIVHSDHMQAKVLGTSFLMNDHVNEPVSDTYLTEGSIDLELKELEKTIRLVPGDKVSYNKETSTVVRINNPHLSIDSWRFGKLSFYNETLFEIGRKLERKFGREILVDENIDSMKFTADFESESLEQILEFFHVSSRLDYKPSKNGYRITKK